MFRVDADTHIEESEATWSHIPEKDGLRPIRFEPPAPPMRGDPRIHELWLIDGRLQLKRRRGEHRVGDVTITDATRELADVASRLRHMDELGIQVQVLYPTLFIQAVTDSPEVELALTRSYNRWIAQATERSGGRLRWVAMAPLLSMDAAVEELRWAKDHGACGVFKKGIECGQRAASDPYFFPLYEEAERLDLPICIHIGNGDPTLPFDRGDSGLNLQLTISAFTSLLVNRVPERFPTARFGFIETSASWVPFLVGELAARQRRLVTPFDLKSDLFRNNRIYVACYTTDDLPYILTYGTEDNLLIGTDYGHSDLSVDIQAHQVLEQKAAAGEVPAAVVRKMMEDNPRRFYGL
jgi:predicted TIM-barrel fold metal-dependent hydrolase